LLAEFVSDRVLRIGSFEGGLRLQKYEISIKVPVFSEFRIGFI
jgi:hypothetical protein